jgi:hypothetical protein
VIALFPKVSFVSEVGVDLEDVERGGFARISLATHARYADHIQVRGVTRTPFQTVSRRGYTKFVKKVPED